NATRFFSLAMFALLSLSSTCNAQAQKTYFSDWPEDLSPQAVGLKAANALLKREHYLHPDNNTIHYAEAVAWYGALDLANQLHDKTLLAALEQRFLPLTNVDSKL